MNDPLQIWRRATGVLAALAVGTWLWLAWNAPADSVQGTIQKILYVHVPCAFTAYLGFIVCALGGALYLWRDEERWDQLAASAAEVGLLFCTLVIATGPVWGKGTWGHWWSWDPRLTVTLLMWFVYLAYVLLRGFTEGSVRTARFAAVYGLVGVLAIPLNYYAIDLFGDRAIHPQNLESDSLGSGMGAPFGMGVLAGLLTFAWLLVLRLDVERLRVRSLAQALRRDAAA